MIDPYQDAWESDRMAGGNMSDQERVQIELTREDREWLLSLLIAQIRDDRERVRDREMRNQEAPTSRKSAEVYTAIAHRVRDAAIAEQVRAQTEVSGE